jgi:hypothetical protein
MDKPTAITCNTLKILMVLSALFTMACAQASQAERVERSQSLSALQELHLPAQSRPDPVTAQAAVRRALSLCAVLYRNQLETVVVATTEVRREDRGLAIQEFKSENARVVQWLKKEGLWPSLSHNEKVMVQKPFGGWSERDRINASWRSEALATLAWALGLSKEFPPFDRSVDEKLWMRRFPFLRSTRTFITRAKLRPKSDLLRQRDIAELWYWRARTTELQQSPDQDPLPEGITYEQIISGAAETAENERMFKRIGNDFPAKGKPYSELTDEEYEICKSIAMERLYGLNWVCGFSKNWDNVPTDT